MSYGGIKKNLQVLKYSLNGKHADKWYQLSPSSSILLAGT